MENTMNSPQQSTLPAAQGQPPGKAGDSPERQAGTPGQFEQTLQRQLAEALQPILGDFQQRVVDSVRQQVQNEGPQGEQSTEQAEVSEGHSAESGGLQGALDQSTTMLRQAMDWLTGIVRLVVDSVRHWLDEVMAWLRRMAMTAFVRVIKAIVQRLLKATIERAASGLEQQGKQKLAAIGQSAASPTQ